jgi:hypothetical protein
MAIVIPDGRWIDITVIAAPLDGAGPGVGEIPPRPGIGGARARIARTRAHARRRSGATATACEADSISACIRIRLFTSATTRSGCGAVVAGHHSSRSIMATAESATLLRMASVRRAASRVHLTVTKR